MFTGIVREIGRVVEAARDGEGLKLSIEAALAEELGPGDSVAVSGVCLTAVEPGDTSFTADLSPETVSRSSLGALAAGDRVNLELPLRPTDRLGGHIVQGHVDGVGTIEAVSGNGPARDVRVSAPTVVLRYVVEKGSVTVDGVSLTVTAVDDAGFSVSLIPETLVRTTLGTGSPGRPVNLEVDVIAKHVEKLLQR
ncbi:MAG: riboflavin synthase [Solirubrobacterales bacterium]